MRSIQVSADFEGSSRTGQRTRINWLYLGQVQYIIQLIVYQETLTKALYVI
jgi:hypothetical protein